MKSFGSEDSCKAFLAHEKWSECSYSLPCGSTHSVKGRTRHHRKCGTCLFDESVTVNTMFHKIKSSLPSAFSIVHLLTTTKKYISSCELARMFGVHQETDLFFKRKVQKAMHAIETGFQLVDIVEVDAVFVGGYEEGNAVRSMGGKSLVLVSVEVVYSETTRKKGKLKRCNSKIIDDASGETLKRALEESDESNDVATTDGWKGYLTALSRRWHDEGSAQGANFDALHWHIFNLMNWVRDIHYCISCNHLQSYLHEFNLRLNNQLQRGLQALPVLTTMATTSKTSFLQLMEAPPDNPFPTYCGRNQVFNSRQQHLPCNIKATKGQIF